MQIDVKKNSKWIQINRFPTNLFITFEVIVHFIETREPFLFLHRFFICFTYSILLDFILPHFLDSTELLSLLSFVGLICFELFSLSYFVVGYVYHSGGAGVLADSSLSDPKLGKYFIISQTFWLWTSVINLQTHSWGFPLQHVMRKMWSAVLVWFDVENWHQRSKISC